VLKWIDSGALNDQNQLGSVSQNAQLVFDNPYENPAFAATYPAPTKENVQHKSSQGVAKDGSTYTGNHYELDVKNNNASFSISYTDYSVAQINTAEHADAVMNSGMAAMHVTSTTHETASIGNLHGRAAMGTSETSLAFERVAFSGNRMWMCSVICAIDACSQRDADTFFNSITIKEEEPKVTGLTFDNPNGDSQFTAVYPTPDGENVKCTPSHGVAKDGGPVTSIACGLAIKDGNAEFFVAYFDYNSPRDSTMLGLDNTLNALLPNYTIATRGHTTIGKLPGRTAAGNDGAHLGFARIANTGNRSWMARVVCLIGYCTQQDADAFFDSIVIR
jgi:hypothetical protein